ncbi:MAG TPA: hypothetical protein DCZ94_20350 [Lentisphaeria bacterium]|nr:MAG: hypothetical protein A2X48_22195 [Lentisphaerae bacterium GWF2_49_21]HBC89299.1 hypothetical protein [Lentisphaeria bacterium]
MKKGTTSKKNIDKSSQVLVYNKEENLSRLSRISILKDFVKENNGNWDHQKWLELCDSIEKSGYVPVDFDQVGLLLEQEKAEFNLSKPSCDSCQ